MRGEGAAETALPAKISDQTARDVSALARAVIACALRSPAGGGGATDSPLRGVRPSLFAPRTRSLSGGGASALGLATT
jgi:hypothetical protein